MKDYCKKAQNSINTASRTKKVEDYFRVSVNFPFLDFMINNMKSRYKEEIFGLYNLGVFVKILISKIKENTIQIFESIQNQFLNIHGLNDRLMNTKDFIRQSQGKIDLIERILE